MSFFFHSIKYKKKTTTYKALDSRSAHAIYGASWHDFFCSFSFNWNSAHSLHAHCYCIRVKCSQQKFYFVCASQQITFNCWYIHKIKSDVRIRLRWTRTKTESTNTVCVCAFFSSSVKRFVISNYYEIFSKILWIDVDVGEAKQITLFPFNL